MTVRSLGVLMLDTSFERIPGDIGNPTTFSFPVHYRTVRGADPRRIVRDQDAALIPHFVEAAHHLIDSGASAITTSCGFLARYQDELSSQIPVPFAASALTYLETLADRFTRVGVITANAEALRPAVLPARGIQPCAVVGLEHAPAFSAAILEGTADLDPVAIAAEVRAVAEGLVRRHPDLQAVILECTNLPPYRAEISRAVGGLPIYDSTTLANDLMRRTAAM